VFRVFDHQFDSSFRNDAINLPVNMPIITSTFTSSLMGSSSCMVSSKLHYPQRPDGKMPVSKKRVAFSSIHFGGIRDDASTMTDSTTSTSVLSQSTRTPLHKISEDEHTRDSDSISTGSGSLLTHQSFGWGSVESRKSYNCLTTLYADHSRYRNNTGDLIDGDSYFADEEEKILCFRAKRMMICRDDDATMKTDDIIIPFDSIDSAAWGYFVDTFEEQ